MSALRREYHIVDVFTDTPFAGNPLAIVIQAEGLSTERMQAVAREFNLSETVFVFEPRDPVNSARIRIFTPKGELPFAGHPTVGAAALVAKSRAAEVLGREEVLVALEEGVGTVLCTARGPKGQPLRASFELPRLPEFVRALENRDAIAAALSLEPGDIGFERHAPAVWTAGAAFAFVPVATREAIARARPRADLFDAAWGGDVPGGDVLGAWLYTEECERAGSDVHARMFAPARGIAEDPATGSAAAAFAGVAVACERPDDGAHTIVIEQGFEMGRPSIMLLGVDVVGGRLVSASVGGAVAFVAKGEIEA